MCCLKWTRTKSQPLQRLTLQPFHAAFSPIESDRLYSSSRRLFRPITMYSGALPSGRSPALIRRLQHPADDRNSELTLLSRRPGGWSAGPLSTMSLQSGCTWAGLGRRRERSQGTSAACSAACVQPSAVEACVSPREARPTAMSARRLTPHTRPPDESHSRCDWTFRCERTQLHPPAPPADWALLLRASTACTMTHAHGPPPRRIHPAHAQRVEHIDGFSPGCTNPWSTPQWHQQQARTQQAETRRQAPSKHRK